MAANIKYLLIDLRKVVDAKFAKKSNGLLEEISKEANHRGLMSYAGEGLARGFVGLASGAIEAGKVVGGIAETTVDVAGSKEFVDTFTTTYNEAEARDQQIRDDFNAGIARMMEQSEAERKRKEEAATKAEYPRRIQQQSTQAQQTYQTQAREDNDVAAQQLEVASSSQSSQTSRIVSSGTSGVWTPPPPLSRERDCRYEPRVGRVGGVSSKGKAEAEEELHDSAKSTCRYLGEGGYKLTVESCESMPILKPVLNNGKWSIKKVGTEWFCLGVVSCNNPEEKCKVKSSGASQQ